MNTSGMATIEMMGGPDDGMTLSVDCSASMLIRRHGDALHEYRRTNPDGERMYHVRVWRDPMIGKHEETA